jgi:hypothetical protein
MENDPRRRRSRGGRRRGGGGGQDRGRPTRTPAEPKPPQPARGLARRERPQRRRAAAVPRSPDELRPGTPCVIVMDCREGDPDRTGAAALFEGFFDLETGDPRRAGFGVPRLRVVRAVPVSPAPLEPETNGVPAGPASPAPLEPRSKPIQAVERLWGFECWWRPDPGNAGLTEIDRIEVEQSKKLLRGLIRDSRRSTRPAIARS